ncbi:NAD(P)-dependent oxidoreductase [Roseomonas terrae]|jgi:3-hydroxyisobutyrate dehydrogenase|uniref:NAD(P)-dependent oxidoreductase n=1 Tax=Neoroseomonas terrae TaxID=424799 RepID=A0ABS5EGK9_9PROT|nr:NAD(P)-dependent oxidoreductase [Neoroseomonas terrae]MBR0650164.1 NAD(P)-dependent oxidoreductase [Neoroseomonas terrae]
MPLNVGCIGIGLMGEAMARRLLERGHRVTAWNLEPERLDTIVPHGAAVAASPAAVAEAADCVLMCVLHTEAVANCVFGPGGIAEAGPQPGKILVDVSTIDPQATRDMAGRLRGATGMRWVDAPASGGIKAAREGSLALMLGGAEEDVADAMPLLRELGSGLTRMGPVGAGQTTKVINQAIVGTGFVLLAEALALAEAAGLDTAKLPEALAGGFADSALLRHRYPRMQQRNFDPPTGYARQLNKDMQAVLAFARHVEAALPLVSAAARQFEAFVAAGNAMADTSSVIRMYRPD